jgi:hypothetical protein
MGTLQWIHVIYASEGSVVVLLSLASGAPRDFYRLTSIIIAGFSVRRPPSGKKFVAAGLQTRPFAAPHKNEDRPHLQVHQITFLLYY